MNGFPSTSVIPWSLSRANPGCIDSAICRELFDAEFEKQNYKEETIIIK